jgi:hypothetical protein
MNPDGVSYLDMGDLYWKRNWHSALNTYWSPLYGWLTGLMFLVTKPTMRWEYPEVHLLNFVIFIAALFCFEFFWRELLASKGAEAWAGGARTYAWVLGYLLFAYVHFVVHSLALVTPDLLVAALVYLATGMMLGFARERIGATSAFLLGVLLGIGYLTKAAMLPFAFVFMMTMLALAWRRHLRKSLVAATFLGCLLICLPFIAALSWNAHQFTWGESAKLNQGWLVNNVRPPYRHWQGDRPGHEDALHPTRRVFDSPDVYEFATPILGTYPVWYAPAYWYAGLDSSMHPVREPQVILKNMKIILIWLFLEPPFLVTFVLLLLMSQRIKVFGRNLMTFWPILAPVVAVFLIYMMVSWEGRYTSGVMLVLWGVMTVSTSIPGGGRLLKRFWAVSLLLVVMVVYQFSSVLIMNYRSFGNSEQSVIVAEHLWSMGIERGDQIALIGDGFSEEFWARLGKVRIVAEVPHGTGFEITNPTAEFWNSTPGIKQTVLDILKRTGAKAVIADTPPTTLPPGWVPVGNTGHAIYFFR